MNKFLTHNSQSPKPFAPPSKLSLRPIYTALSLIFGILLGAGGLFAYQEYIASPPVGTYDECITSKGSIIQESYPATCVTRDGKRFIQPIDGSDINPIYTEPTSCTTDADCTIGIQSDGCCMCPKAINVDQIGNDGWTKYGSTQKPSGKTRTCETFAACAPCESPAAPVCQNNVCTFQNATSTPQPGAIYTCPKTEWVDCMPKTRSLGDMDASIFCSRDYLVWAKANCPNFQGAAL